MPISINEATLEDVKLVNKTIRSIRATFSMPYNLTVLEKLAEQLGGSCVVVVTKKQVTMEELAAKKEEADAAKAARKAKRAKP